MDKTPFSMIPVEDLKCGFKDDERLGESNSNTYQGTLFGLRVAAKVIPGKSREEVEKILEEQQTTWREINNPYICLYLGASYHLEKGLVLISERMDVDLDTFMTKNENNAPSLFQRMRMAYQIACGLTWTARKLPHHNLKPTNILVAGLSETQEWTENSGCKVADFGIESIESR